MIKKQITKKIVSPIEVEEIPEIVTPTATKKIIKPKKEEEIVIPEIDVQTEDEDVIIIDDGSEEDYNSTIVEGGEEYEGNNEDNYEENGEDNEGNSEVGEEDNQIVIPEKEENEEEIVIKKPNQYEIKNLSGYTIDPADEEEIVIPKKKKQKKEKKEEAIDYSFVNKARNVYKEYFNKEDVNFNPNKNFNPNIYNKSNIISTRFANRAANLNRVIKEFEDGNLEDIFELYGCDTLIAKQVIVANILDAITEAKLKSNFIDETGFYEMGGKCVVELVPPKYFPPFKNSPMKNGILKLQSYKIHSSSEFSKTDGFNPELKIKVSLDPETNIFTVLEDKIGYHEGDKVIIKNDKVLRLKKK